MVQKHIDLTTWTNLDEESLPFYFNRATESFHLLQHRHDFMELAYVAEGSGFHYIDDQIIPVSKGDWFILPLGVSHVFRPTGVRPSHPLIVNNCTFKPERLFEELSSIPGATSLQYALHLLQLTPNIEPVWQHLRDPDGRYGDWFRLCQHEYTQRKPGFAARLYSMFIELAVMLERQRPTIESSQGKRTAAAAGSLEAAIHHIDRHFTEPLHVKEIAAHFQMSERHFHRLFKQQIGLTFSAYLQTKRIEQSCRLLLTTKLPVQEISQQVGYQDKKFFLALFKKITGHTPRQFRHLNAAMPGPADNVNI
ncbi:helix-turn-helix domain-containing protein [Paenibacillus sp. GCM10027626]|uniref:AraC family transcriptional regulator n=1 Tax=Paenibacillus sp. GCM10027626 TaxID=3273411 RepID=UPI0036274201